MYLNTFAPGLDAVDMTRTDEYQSLAQSADDLGITYKTPVRYVSRNVVANGLRFHILEWGEPGRPQLLMLHGGNQTAHSWDLVSLHLADRFHIIAVDQRGHGDSEWPRDGAAKLEDRAADAVAIMTVVGFDRPIVMAHSMGGLTTMTMLRDYPGKASRVVLVDIGPETPDGGAKEILNFVRAAGEFTSIEDFTARVSKYDPFRSPAHIARSARYNLMERVDGKLVSKHDRRRYEVEGANSAPPELYSRPTLDDARTFHVPVLVVRGAQSNVLTEELADRFASALPQGQVVTVADCGHNVHSQNTTGFIEAVVPFITAS